MGRYDFRPLRVHQTATQLLETNRLPSPPAWYNVVGSIPPSATLVRPQPQQHIQSKRPGPRKRSKLFKPLPVGYEEDKLRSEFFGDHPWELARPRVILENDGKDAQRTDWSRIRQPGRPLTGESVVQRQMWLQNNVPGMTHSKAYDQARKEFYALRLQEEVEAQVAKEEAVHTGAYFGKSALQVGMELENVQMDKFRTWAEKEAIDTERRAAAYAGFEAEHASEEEPDEGDLAEKADGAEDGGDSAGIASNKRATPGQRPPLG